MDKPFCPECESKNTKMIDEEFCVEIWECEDCGFKYEN